MKQIKIHKYINPRLWFSFFAHLCREADARLFGIGYRQYHQYLRNLVLKDGCDSLLDVGCGSSSPIAGFASEIKYRVGVDAHLGSIEISGDKGIHSEYVMSDILEIGEKFSPSSFDCVTLLEVIEHLPREAGEKLLKQCERLAKGRVIVSTPNGFVPQDPTPNNPFQEHVSGWSAMDFRSRGYEVLGMAGWKHFRGQLMRPRWRPHFLFERISLLTEAWFINRSDYAFQILCSKDVSKGDS
jgi:hypothetical protein